MGFDSMVYNFCIFDSNQGFYQSSSLFSKDPELNLPKITINNALQCIADHYLQVLKDFTSLDFVRILMNLQKEPLIVKAVA